MYDGEKVLPWEGRFGLCGNVIGLLRKSHLTFAEQLFDICAGRDKQLDEGR